MKVILLCAFCFATAHATLPPPSAINFLGVGYNILDGNPDGSDISIGGVDPGLLTTRRVFEMTYNYGKKSADYQYYVPDQVVFMPRSSCANTITKEMFWGTESYQQKLKKETSWSVGLDRRFLGFEFSKSKSYEEVLRSIDSNRYVYYEDRTVCNLGQARYTSELAFFDKYPLTKSFVIEACNLPAVFDNDAYMDFLDDWGTNVILEINVGTKKLDRYEETQEAFVYYAMETNSKSTTSGGSFLGFGSSVTVTMSDFESGMTSETKFGSFQYTLNSGDEDMHEPISVTLLGMEEVFTTDYWTQFSKYASDGLCKADWINNLATIQANMDQAMWGYAAHRGAIMSTDPVVQIPITWPQGTYGLTQPKVGCPLTPHFNWHTGWRKHDTEKRNGWSDGNHFVGPYWENDMYDHFCMKHDTKVTEYDWTWPDGEYCVYQAGTTCPSNLKSGAIFWDNKNSGDNSYGGSVPEGTYDHNTKMYFCCQNDGFTTNQIYLPTDSPFYLFPFKNQCQQVVGMTASMEWFYFDNENTSNDDYKIGYYPYSDGDKAHKIRYCYYTPK
ncbi:uncharacterized protein LOC117106502 [Anneissia japonica]|uniref:uncharacterized protein LOC117106502 n=1 Tax=Anneissia japonica TaxID=1529436 RepID=UPI00142561FE|nr:uncharacterized protein LOC117106502 [Anneissia japonica]